MKLRASLCLTALLMAFSSTRAQEVSDAELAKATQNPIANLISVPFQNNTDFDIGHQDKVRNILNIQPVIPFRLNESWNLITGRPTGAMSGRCRSAGASGRSSAWASSA